MPEGSIKRVAVRPARDARPVRLPRAVLERERRPEFDLRVELLEGVHVRPPSAMEKSLSVGGRLVNN